jgi:hypothetical protein
MASQDIDSHGVHGDGVRGHQRQEYRQRPLEAAAILRLVGNDDECPQKGHPRLEQRAMAQVSRTVGGRRCSRRTRPMPSSTNIRVTGPRNPNRVPISAALLDTCRSTDATGTMNSVKAPTA